MVISVGQKVFAKRSKKCGIDQRMLSLLLLVKHKSPIIRLLQGDDKLLMFQQVGNGLLVIICQDGKLFSFPQRLAVVFNKLETRHFM